MPSPDPKTAANPSTDPNRTAGRPPAALARRPAQPEGACPDPAPLVVDLDGTLLRTDLLMESVLVLAKKRPLDLLKLPLWLARGRALLKQKVAACAMPDIRTLPYRPDVLAQLEAEKAKGRCVVLATAADESLAQRVAQNLGLFNRVYASDGRVNLSGEHKRDRLVAAFGEKGFDYIGNALRDLPVWRAARTALLVRPSHTLRRRAGQAAPVAQVFEDRGPAPLRSYLQALRPHHWVKNGLILLPLAFTQGLSWMQWLPQALLAVAAFSLCASSVYLLNDLLDLPYDRRHPQKKERALASGRIGIVQAIGLTAALLATAVLIGAKLSGAFLAVMSGYYLSTLVYSLRAKDVPILDVLVLAGGYAARVAAGALAVGLVPSTGLLAFCLLLFFSLTLIKRHAELTIMGSVSASGTHGYFYADRGLLAAQGVASGYLSVLVLALYVNAEVAPQAPPRHSLFWGVYLLLWCWINLLWLRAHRGQIPNDPVLYALRNPASLLLMAGMAALALLAR